MTSAATGDVFFLPTRHTHDVRHVNDHCFSRASNIPNVRSTIQIVYYLVVSITSAPQSSIPSRTTNFHNLNTTNRPISTAKLTSKSQLVQIRRAQTATCDFGECLGVIARRVRHSIHLEHGKNQLGLTNVSMHRAWSFFCTFEDANLSL